MTTPPHPTLLVSPYLNLALHLNDVRPVREVSLLNEGAAPLTGLTVVLRSDPSAVLQHTWRGVDLHPGERLALPLTDLRVDYDYFDQLSEAIPGRFTLTVADATGAELARVTDDARLLPSMHWGGTAGVPELLAAHVLPNDPAVGRLLRRAAELLAPQHYSLDGYGTQNDLRAAGAQVLAVLTAIRELGLHYALPPRSFERTGQKVRSPTAITTEGLGTCLDLTLLGAAALEQAGLHPGIVLTAGHCFLTCWLQPSPYSAGVITDLQSLRKAQANGLLLAGETTLLVGNGADVNASLAAGNRHLTDDAAFEVAIDIYAARNGERIRPLGQAKAAPALAREATPERARLDLSALGGIHGTTRGDDDDGGVLKGDRRVDHWKRQLLDLTRRNRLLNWRPVKASLRLPHLAPTTLEDAVADGKRFKFEALDPQRGDDKALRRDLDEAHYAAAVRRAFTRDTLLVVDRERDLLASLIALERGNRTAVEEGGASTLYLALGFAVKADPNNAARPEYRAPLILLPVDLKRRRAGNSFTLAKRDDEAMLNPTLLELLRREHGITFEGLTEELPTDDHGIDVAGILAVARDALLNAAGWEVTEDVVLAEFSFQQHLMWRDLDRFEGHLRENPVVAHLIDRPREPYFVPGASAQPDYPAHDTLDETFPVAEMYTPMSADSSQLAAVRAASLGIDYVLEGPPGTGKSQTITNLIAQCLGEGKTVLFVSEKTAALEVVERRLNGIGLGEFCLELHSNRANKSHVYDQLKAAWAAAAETDVDWATEAAQLTEIRSALNHQVQAVHRRRDAGLSVFEGIALSNDPLASVAPAPPREWLRRQRATALSSHGEQVRRMGAYLSDVAMDARRDLCNVGGAVDDDSLATAAGAAIDAADSLEPLVGTFVKTAGLSTIPTSRRDLLALLQFGDLLSAAKGHPYTHAAAMVDSGSARRRQTEISELLDQYARDYRSLSAPYRTAVLNFDLEGLQAKWAKSTTAWSPLRTYRQWQIKRQLKAMVKVGEPRDPGADIAYLVAASASRKRLEKLGVLPPDLDDREIATSLGQSEWMRSFVAIVVEPHPETRQSIAQTLRLDTSTAEHLLGTLADDGPSARVLLANYEDLKAAFQVLTEAAERLRRAMHHVEGDDAWLATTNYANSITSEANAILTQRPAWRRWGLYADLRASAYESGLAYVAPALERDPDITGAPAAHLFEVGFARAWAKDAIEADPVLKGFSGSLQADLITRFRALDERFGRLAQREIRARLQGRRQGLYTQEMRPHLAVWNNEKDKKRGQLPVRQLIKGMGPLLPQLTPCLLMSPLSVAQYLPADSPFRFDVVVFDEASQIPVYVAIGAIARARQVVVVGDSKQLPPTSFFATQEEEADAELDGDGRVEDMESILDEMQAASLQSKRLRWHYRSRAESLIAFSNRTYYEGELNTFPAPVSHDDAVGWHKVDSRSYRKGTNPVEAEALVAYLVARLRDTPPRETTFGVVTFSQAQRTVIEDLLEVRRGELPEIEPHFDPEFDERVFVKNIENVQGDERDVILFSMTYGPDEAGRLAMRFGPMNQVGGERRLNVAVTRARREMQVFSSMEPEQIDLKRLGDSAQGARDMRRFMEFAKQRSYHYAKPIASADDAAQGPFETAVADALRARGFETDPQVGVSGYRTDLGVRDPRREGRYLAGVECDGASYHASATARERDILRQAVLEGLGWNILRVWSLDWWHDSARVADKLAAELQAILDRPLEASTDDTDAPAVAPTPVPTAAQDAPEESPDGTFYRRPTSEDLGRTKAQTLASARSNREIYPELRHDLAVAYARAILRAEGPLLIDDLVKRIATDGFGVARTGGRIKTAIKQVVREQAYVSKDTDGATLVWADAAQANSSVCFRPPAPDAPATRGIAEIPMVELTALAKELLPLGLDGDDLIREMGGRIGLGSVRGSSRRRVEEAVERAWA